MHMLSVLYSENHRTFLCMFHVEYSIWDRMLLRKIDKSNVVVTIIVLYLYNNLIKRFE